MDSQSSQEVQHTLLSQPDEASQKDDLGADTVMEADTAKNNYENGITSRAKKIITTKFEPHLHPCDIAEHEYERKKLVPYLECEIRARDAQKNQKVPDKHYEFLLDNFLLMNCFAIACALWHD